VWKSWSMDAVRGGNTVASGRARRTHGDGSIACCCDKAWCGGKNDTNRHCTALKANSPTSSNRCTYKSPQGWGQPVGAAVVDNASRSAIVLGAAPGSLTVIPSPRNRPWRPRFHGPWNRDRRILNYKECSENSTALCPGSAFKRGRQLRFTPEY
jgi:hypothetical protein